MPCPFWPPWPPALSPRVYFTSRSTKLGFRQDFNSSGAFSYIWHTLSKPTFLKRSKSSLPLSFSLSPSFDFVRASLSSKNRSLHSFISSASVMPTFLRLSVSLSTGALGYGLKCPIAVKLLSGRRKFTIWFSFRSFTTAPWGGTQPSDSANASFGFLY